MSCGKSGDRLPRHVRCVQNPDQGSREQETQGLSGRHRLTRLMLIVSAALLETELRRMATRTRVAQRSVTDVLERIALIDMDRGIFREAGLLPGVGLRSLDALNIAVAERAAADEFITYDPKQAAAAESMGLRVVRPE